MNDTSIQRSPKEDHERVAKLLNGYAAFIAALLIATIAKSDNYPHAYIIITLLASSLPSLIALLIIDFHVKVNQRRNASMFRGLASFLGFLPSLLGITMLIGHFSFIGGVFFLLLTVFWILAVYHVAVHGFTDGTTT
jgi:hypothetical protein